MITEYDAIQRAKHFVLEKLGNELPVLVCRFQQDPTKTMRKYGFSFEPNDERVRPCWSVTFEFVVDSKDVLAGGLIVDVDAETGTPRFFDEAFTSSGVVSR